MMNAERKTVLNSSFIILYLIGDLSAGKKGGSINLAFNMAAEAMRSISTCQLPSPS